MANIPPREPVGDPFSGILCRVGEKYVLSPVPLAGAEVVAHGVMLRYGIRLLEKPFLSIIPGLIALERGQLMTGDYAWDFLQRRSNLFPRTEVYGYMDDGADEMRTVKWLDFAIPPKVLAYADEQATVPLAEVHAFIGSAADFPPRAVEFAPVYDSPAQLDS